MSLNIGFTDHGLKRLRERAQVPQSYEDYYVQEVIKGGQCWSNLGYEETEKYYYNGLFVVVKPDTDGYDYLVITCFFEESEYNEEVKV